MSISSEISRISGNVSDALTAIANKGVTVPSGSNSDDLADLIGQISGGGGTTYVTTFDEDMEMHGSSPGWSTYEYYLVPFLANQTYRVTFNGIQYICETVAAPPGVTIDGYAIGNAAIAGGTDTGEPFLIYRADFGDPEPFHAQLEMDAYASGTVHLKIELAQSGGGSTLITKTITANGTYDAEDDDADGYSEVTVNVSGSYTLIGSTEITVNTSSTTAAQVGTLTISPASALWTAGKIIYIKIRDKAGKRNGYFYGSDSFYLNYYPLNPDSSPNTASFSVKFAINYRTSGYGLQASTATNGYGVYPYEIQSDGDIPIYARYSSSSSRTINGTYTVEVYALAWPDNVSPFL